MTRAPRESDFQARTASDIARTYERQAARLLERLAEPGCHAERRGDQVVLVRKGGTQRVNRAEDPLDLFRRGKPTFFLIGEAELAAGDRLRRDLVFAQSLPQVTANWSRLVVDGAGYHDGLSVSERVVAARARVEAALRAVGPDFSGILMDVCGFSKGLETVEKEHNLPQRAGKVALGYALRALARHYGLASAAVGKAQVPMRHWGAPDYRPRLASG